MTILDKIHSEKSTACLMALKAWAQSEGRWLPEYDAEYERREKEIKEGRK